MDGMDRFIKATLSVKNLLTAILGIIVNTDSNKNIIFLFPLFISLFSLLLCYFVFEKKDFFCGYTSKFAGIP